MAALPELDYVFVLAAFPAAPDVPEAMKKEDCAIPKYVNFTLCLF